MHKKGRKERRYERKMESVSTNLRSIVVWQETGKKDRRSDRVGRDNA